MTVPATGPAADLVSWIADRIDESGLPDETGLLILAALDGDQQLADLLAGAGPSGHDTRDTAAECPNREVGGTYLSSIEVEGFRGIGPATTLELRPEPGLTIVAGRNGSGKSSMSEALELVLTGDAYRWSGKKSTQWREKWRNLHHDRARIAARFVEEGDAPLTVSVDWADVEDDVTRYRIRTQRHQQKQQDGRAGLGWDSALQRFRPILSYDELGAMLAGAPSDLHDAISQVLGVGAISAALDRLGREYKAHKAPGDTLTKQRRELATATAQLDDDRAAAVAPLLAKTTPDIAKIPALVTGDDSGDGTSAALGALAQLSAPATPDQARMIAKRLRASAAELAAADAAVHATTLESANLLEQALRLHSEHGDMSCPVCGAGTLDAEWARAGQEAVRARREQTARLRTVLTEVELARAAAYDLLRPPPARLDEAPVPELAEHVRAARTAWAQWRPLRQGDTALADTELADHLESGIDTLTDAVDELRAAAAELYAGKEDRWQPLRARILTWCTDWAGWLADKPAVDRLGAAKKWLQDNDLQLRNDRLAPIRDGARHAWEILRQESNVEIGDLSLEGSATRRKLRIESRIDGIEAGGLPVLSQGELHALALALFLPRATMAESPFRFLVLDDPVQAMDPAKVDGLVALLSELAQTRQVIVLSHDDRLSAAVRRGAHTATIVEVTRAGNSQVSISPVTDPARRYLKDAFGLVTEYENNRIPEDALRRTLPGMLRFAVEAAARHKYFAGNLAHGRRLADLEREWEDESTTRGKVTLAVFGEPRENHELDAWARAPYRKNGLSTVGRGMHAGLVTGIDPAQAARDVQRLVADIEAGAR